ncbi:lysophospholipase [Obba rivulosa]|uniref:Lysophospholipase n=1 Tax=Obba rivulosa TaxID=1052685 RepID=A0A8E2ARK4_9APHY|nr:lysophospholipase [Obba rivulosa]
MSASSPFSEAWLTGPGDLKFYTRTYSANAGAPKAVALFVHGFAEHVGRYDHAFPVWAERGITVFAYDQRGFGRTALDPQRSKQSAYAVTSWKDQFGDIEWWLKHLKKEYPTQPLFLVGHSMGGGLALAFPTRTQPPPSQETVGLLSGVIATSPLLLQTFPASKLLRWAGGKARFIAPSMTIAAPVVIEDLSHNQAANEANAKDPLIIQKGSLSGLHDMLSGGEQLLQSDFQHWPRTLPVLIVHGTDDRVTSHKASQELYNKLTVEDKKLSLYEGGYHELVHEPDGVKEKFTDELISWVEAHTGTQPDASKL